MYISRETEPWPIKLRNNTNLNFTFQQAVSLSFFNLFILSDVCLEDDETPKDGCSPRPLSAHITAEYTWDYPTAENKRMLLVMDGVPLPRTIDMMAIGVQPPIKLGVSRRFPLQSLIIG